MTPVYAATYTVTVTNDELDGSCAGATVASVGGAGDVSLREAICIANATAGADTITVPAGAYAISIANLEPRTSYYYGVIPQPSDTTNQVIHLPGTFRTPTVPGTPYPF